MNKDLIKVIRKLKKRYMIFVLSNNNESARKSINFNNINKLFDKILFSYEVGMKKPNPLFFKKLLKGTSLKFDQCLLVDDREDNTKVAEKLGMRGILFKDNKNLIKDLRKEGIEFK